jgi:hypothetical protein
MYWSPFHTSQAFTFLFEPTFILLFSGTARSLYILAIAHLLDLRVFSRVLLGFFLVDADLSTSACQQNIRFCVLIACGRNISFKYRAKCKELALNRPVAIAVKLEAVSFDQCQRG